MEGGVGNDTYHIDGMDTVHEREEEGTDRVVSSVSYQLPWNVEQLELTGRAALRGTGNGLSNLIIGNAAANLLDGGDRGDVMRGGDGNDVYVVDDFRDATVEDSAGGGIDTVLSHVSRVLAPHIENLTLFEDGWSANSSGTGNSLANRIIGNKLDNRLDGRAGADYLVGGDGNDVCYVDHVGDQVIEAVDEGIDTVKSLVSYLLPTHAEILTLAGTGSSAGTGNWQDNRIVGNGASNRLEGLGGADRLQGGAGWDSLFGGAGIDSLEGGAGADKFGFDAVLNRIGNVDKVLDFSSADDRIDLASSIFSQADVGQLRLAAYHEGTSALDAADRIIYDQITGSIFYDADGIGGVAQVLFAKVTPGLDLVAADFFVYSG